MQKIKVSKKYDRNDKIIIVQISKNAFACF